MLSTLNALAEKGDIEKRDVVKAIKKYKIDPKKISPENCKFYHLRARFLSKIIDIIIPALGDFDSIEVIEIINKKEAKLRKKKVLSL